MPLTCGYALLRCVGAAMRVCGRGGSALLRDFYDSLDCKQEKQSNAANHISKQVCNADYNDSIAMFD